jgi:hypothetical protein
MADVADGFDTFYADRLWQLLPGVYRALDSSDPEVTGPLQELSARIGAQMAVVRRSIDRLWADQSIETCDDWVIPYIGDLLGTNLVNGLDARAQRLDVAKTIHYRRRKGTIAILEEIARDVTGWDAHVVEAFRRLGRTRHSLDPPVGTALLTEALPTPCPRSPAPDGPDARDLLSHEGLVGRLTGTLAGGLADLRSAHGARLADSPFDEYFHTADVRYGRGSTGRYGIPKLLVFVWRLVSFPVTGATPVAVQGCPNQYVFDPTGRRIALFLPPLGPEPDDYADTWTSSREWQVPGPASDSLEQAIADPGTGPPRHAPYPTDGGPIVAPYAASAGTPAEPVAITVAPDVGQFGVSATPDPPLLASYQYGFPAMIGAGPYDRTLLGDPPPAVGAQAPPVSGGGGLDSALSASAGAGTITIADSRTYDAVSAVGSTAQPIGGLLIRAGADQRPVVRLPAAASAADPPAAWVFTGGANADLTLDGLLVSGGDVVLRGAFATVRITGCTTDPGSLAPGGGLATSVDGRELAPARIWIEADPDAPAGAPGAIEQLSIDHCVLGPIRTRNGGAVERAQISDSTVQGLETGPSGAGGALTAADLHDPKLLARALASADPLSALIYGRLPAAAQQAVDSSAGGVLLDASLAAIVDGLNTVIAGPSIYDAAAFGGVALDPATKALLGEGAAADVAALNRGLLACAYPIALGAAALALADADVTLARVTVLGRCALHRLRASDTIFGDFAAVEDAQDGCVRFCAVGSGSRVPRPYRCAAIAPGAPLFTSSVFGEAGYAQLLETVDRAIVSGAGAITISAGAESGSEMGAYCGQLAPIKERGLLVKYAEYMPLGLTPVIVHVT